MFFRFTHPVRGHRRALKRKNEIQGRKNAFVGEIGTLKMSTNSTVGAAADLAVMIFLAKPFLWERLFI